MKVLLGIGAPLEGRLALHDALRGRWDELPLARDPRRAPVTTLEDVAVTCSLPGPAAPGAEEVTAAELPDLLAQGVRVIDVREDEELAVVRLPGAEHLPLQRLLDGEAEGSLDGAVLVCAAGRRSASAQRVLAERGVHVRSLTGGVAALAGSGLLDPPR